MMMEVAGQVLEVAKLVDKIKAIQKQHDGATVTLQQSPELSMLFKRSGDLDAATCCAAAEGLVALVIGGTCDFNLILQGLLNQVPTAKNLLGVVKSVSDLMILQILSSSQEDEQPKIPYGIRSPPHPFISVLTQRPDSWPLLLQQISSLLNTTQTRLQRCCVPLLVPFIRFVLLDPQANEKFSVFRNVLGALLMKGSKVKIIQTALNQELTVMVPCLQINTREQLIQSEQYLRQLLTSCLRNVIEVSPSSHTQLIESGLSLCQLMFKQNLDPSSLLEVCRDLLETTTQVSGRFMFHIAELLLTAPCHQQPMIIAMAEIVLDKSTIHKRRHLVGTLLMPLLQLLSIPKMVTMETASVNLHAKASQLLRRVESILAQDEDADTEAEDDGEENLNEDLLLIKPSAKISNSFCKLAETSETARKWLGRLMKLLKSDAARISVTSSMTCLVASLCVTFTVKDDLELALEALALLCKTHPDKCCGFFPVVMYRLGRERDPEKRLALLYAVPQLAANKALVPPILRTIQTLATSVPLKPVALTLMTSLWQQHERVFPYLQKMLEETSQSLSLGNQLDPLLLARASCIQKICETRPNQHGVDVLPALSAILNDCSSPQQASAAALALQGLRALCQAEVVDIQTTWSVLSGKLKQEKRTLVVKELCSFFSLVPSLQVETTEFEEFESEVIGYLWNYTRSSDHAVSCAAFEALAAFSRDSFKLGHLPDKITENARDNLLKSEDLTADEVADAVVPGDCFIRLMETLPVEVMPAYQKLLQAMMRQEAATLPKHVYHAARHAQSRSAQDKAAQAIPTMIQKKHDSGKQPALRPMLAAGLLLSYSPVLETGGDGKPNKVALARHGRGYHQTLYALLNEVSLAPRDWLCSLTLPQAWASFMERCYHAYTQSRKAELDLELQRGRVSDAEEHEIQGRAAWLWARDKLLDLIKSSSKGSPAVQANCIGALIGLILAFNNHTSNMDAAAVKAITAETPEHITPRHWLTTAIQTLMAIVDPAYKPAVRVWPIGGQRAGSEGSLVASVLARGACCMSLHLVVPLILTTSPDLLLPLVSALETGLPGQPDSDHSSLLQTHHGLGLGALLAHLFQTQYIDASGTDGLVAVWRAVNSLETACYSESPHRLGSLLGLGLCLSAMCEDGKTDSRVHILSALEQMSAMLDGGTDSETDIQQGMALAFASTSANAFRCNLIDMEVVNQHVAKIYQLHMQDTSNVGTTVSLALMFDFLLKAGHPTVADLSQTVMESWARAADDMDMAWSDRFAPLAGLFTMGGIHQLWLTGAGDSSPGGNEGSIRDLVKTSNQILNSTSCDPSLQGNCAWMLGALHSSVSKSSESSSNVPGNYKYLGEGSVLRPSVDLLLHYGKQPILEESLGHVTSVLESLALGPQQPLPPINWSTVLSPYLRMSHEPKLQVNALEVTLKQSPSNSSAALLLSCWIIPPLSHSLQDMSLRKIFSNMSSVIKAVPSGKLQIFLECLLEPLLMRLAESPPEDTSVQQFALAGLQMALHVPDPPQAVMMILYESLTKILRAVPCCVQTLLPLYRHLGWCLAEVPDQILDPMMEIPEAEQGVASLKDLMSRVVLVGSGAQPLQYLNRALELFMYSNTKFDDTITWLLLSGFHGNKDVKSAAHSGATKQQQWVLELMGHQKNMASGVIPMTEGASLEEVLEFAFLVTSCAVVSWSGICVHSVMELMVLSSESSREGPVVVPENVTVTLGAVLPKAFEKLLQDKAWQNMAPKFLDWLMYMCELSAKSSWRSLHHRYLTCLYTLRHCRDFNKMAVWTRAFSLSTLPENVEGTRQ